MPFFFSPMKENQTAIIFPHSLVWFEFWPQVTQMKPIQNHQPGKFTVYKGRQVCFGYCGLERGEVLSIYQQGCAVWVQERGSILSSTVTGRWSENEKTYGLTTPPQSVFCLWPREMRHRMRKDCQDSLAVKYPFLLSTWVLGDFIRFLGDEGQDIKDHKEKLFQHRGGTVYLRMHTVHPVGLTVLSISFFLCF